MSTRCRICAHPDMRRLVELGWNAHMSAPQIASAFDGILTSASILRHLREHVEEGAQTREIPIDKRSTRERVEELQRLQLDEIERRIALAQEWAAYARANGNPTADWSEKFDLLAKDVQAAIASIQRAQALTDRRAISEAGLKLDIYRMMLGGGQALAPKHLIADTPGEYTEEGSDRALLPAGAPDDEEEEEEEE